MSNTFTPKSRRLKVEFGAIGGVNFSDFSHSIGERGFDEGDNTSQRSFDYENTTSIHFGAYVESSLPFFNNKLSLFVEALYFSFDSNEIPTGIAGQQAVNTPFQFRNLDFTGGARYYLYLNPQSNNVLYKLFVESGVSVGFNARTRLPGLLNRDTDNKNLVSVPLGIGLKAGRFALSYRYYLNRDLLGSYINRSSNLQMQTVNLSVKIF